MPDTPMTHPIKYNVIALAAIEAAIDTLENITTDDAIGHRFSTWREGVDVNQSKRGNVQATLDKLLAAKKAISNGR